MLVIFYSRNFDRSTWFVSGAVNDTAFYSSPNYLYEASVPFDGDFDKLCEEKPLLSIEEIRAEGHIVEYVG